MGEKVSQNDPFEDEILIEDHSVKIQQKELL